jgi:hypothetical protein
VTNRLDALRLQSALQALAARAVSDHRLLAELQRARREFFGGDAAPAPVAREQRFLEWFLLERESLALAAVPAQVLDLAGDEEALLGSCAGVWSIESVQGHTAEARDLQDDDVLDLLAPADALQPGDLMVGRIYSFDGAGRPGGRAGWQPSAAVAIHRPGSALAAAFQRDLARLALDRRLSQAELEHLLLRRQRPVSAAPVTRPVEHIEAELDAVLHAGGAQGLAPAISRELAAAERPGAVAGPLLDQLAFDTDVDLDRARRLLVELWGAHHANAGTSVAGSVAEAIAPSAGEWAADESPSPGSPSTGLPPAGPPPAGLPPDGSPSSGSSVTASSRSGSPPTASPRSGASPSGSPPIVTPIEAAAPANGDDGDPSPPGDGETLGARLLRTLDAGLASHKDVGELFSELEAMAGIEPEDESDDDEEGAADEAGDLAPLVAEFLWETNLGGSETESVLRLWLGLQQNAALPHLDLEQVTSQDLLRLLLHVYLRVDPAQRAAAVRGAFAALREFSAWAEETQDMSLGAALAECERELLLPIDRLQAAGLHLSGNGTDAGRQQLLRVEDVGADGFGVRSDEGHHWLSADREAAALLRPGDVVLGSFAPGRRAALRGLVVVLPGCAEALIG